MRTHVPSCTHIFCEACVDELCSRRFTQQNANRCPLCRTVWYISEYIPFRLQQSSQSEQEPAPSGEEWHSIGEEFEEYMDESSSDEERPLRRSSDDSEREGERRVLEELRRGRRGVRRSRAEFDAESPPSSPLYLNHRRARQARERRTITPVGRLRRLQQTRATLNEGPASDPHLQQLSNVAAATLTSEWANITAPPTHSPEQPSAGLSAASEMYIPDFRERTHSRYVHQSRLHGERTAPDFAETMTRREWANTQRADERNNQPEELDRREATLEELA